MKKNFYIDPVSDVVYHWEDIISDLNQTKVFNTWINETDYYSLCKKLILSLIIDVPIVLTDANCTESERTYFRSQLNEDDLQNVTINLRINGLDDLRELLLQRKRNWSVMLFSSGTGGKPKKVIQTWERLLKNVQISTRHKGDIWALAYNPAHIAGLQVLLQAFYNLNTIVQLFGTETRRTQHYIHKYQVSHISATSAFYKQILPFQNVIDSVKRVTFGGEKINIDLVEKMREYLPNAKFINIYASTEAGTLLKSENDIFSIEGDDLQWYRIDNSHLLIHRSQISSSIQFEGDWYNSGDLVEVLSYSPVLRFKFLDRGPEFVNIGGYTVHLEEVMNVLLSLEDVKDVRLYTKENSVMGSVLLCDVSTDNENIKEKDIRIQLQSRLSEYKIPRIINLYSNLPLSRTGKKIL